MSELGSCVHDSKIVKKSSKTGFSSESRDGALSERTFFDLRSVEMAPKGSSERPARPPATLLGSLGALLGRSWNALGTLLVTLGRSWAALGPLLGGSWALPGAPGAPLGDLGSILEPLRVDFASPGVFLRRLASGL